MAKLIVRIYGRFVFATPAAEGGTAVGGAFAVAVDPSADPDLGGDFSPHRLFMTIPRRAVSLGGELKPPSFDLTAGEDVQGAEHLVWDLHGCEVTIQSNDTPYRLRANTLPDSIVLPDLRVLHDNAEFDQDCLQAGAKGGLVAGVIMLGSGFGTPRQVATERSVFAPLGNLNKPSPIYSEALLADLVEVVLESDGLAMTIKGPDDDRPWPISITSDSEYPTIISVSHLCVSAPADVDREFAAFYGVLKGYSVPDDRLVPKDFGQFGEDCYKSAMITFQKVV